MAKIKITAALIKEPPSIPAGSRKLRITDTEIRGFTAEFWRSGTAVFWLKYTDQDGRTREQKIGRAGDISVEQARRRAKELRGQVTLNGNPAAERDKIRAIPSFGAFVTERYLPHVKQRLRSYRDHESFCRLRLLPVWGNRRLNDIRPTDLIDLQRKLKEDGLANGTINRYTALVRRIFNLALQWEVIEGRNPAQHADFLREQGRKLFLKEPEARRLIQALREDANQTVVSCIVLLALTGARKSEALNMRWSDVDFELRTWQVPLSKSGQPRDIPLSDSALKLIRQQPRLPDCEWVFPGEVDGRPLENVRRCWERVKRKASLPADLRVHDLRHSFASMLVNRGRPIYEVAEILGHSQISTTKRYSHFQNERLVEAANIVGVIAGPSSSSVAG